LLDDKVEKTYEKHSMIYNNGTHYNFTGFANGNADQCMPADGLRA